MTKEFDPTKPCQYRGGGTPVAVFALPVSLEAGETIVSVRRTGLAHTHFPDGRHRCSGLSDLDLINIPGEVEVVRWAVFDRATGDYMMRSYSSEQQAIENAKNSQVVVRMTGKYTR